MYLEKDVSIGPKTKKKKKKNLSKFYILKEGITMAWFILKTQINRNQSLKKNNTKQTIKWIYSVENLWNSLP